MFVIVGANDYRVNGCRATDCRASDCRASEPHMTDLMLYIILIILFALHITNQSN